MKLYLLPLFALLIVGCGNRTLPSIIAENRTRQAEQTDSIVRDIYERDTIRGDFNGDGRIESAYSESNPDEYCNPNAVNDGQPNRITFSNTTIPAITTEFQIERLTNEGDLNGDGIDEIGFVERAVSRICGYTVYSLLHTNQWKKLLRVDYDALNPPSDVVQLNPNKKGYVIVQTVEWVDGDAISIEKSVKIK